MAYVSIWKVAALGVGPGGEAIVNTFHIGIEAAESATLKPEDVALAWQPIVEANLPPLVTPDYTMLSQSALCVKGVNLGKSGTVDATAATVGTLGGGSAPLTVAMIGIRRSNTTGRHSRGRCFLSPTSAGAVNVDGRFTEPAGAAAIWGALAGSAPIVGAVQYDPILFDSVAITGSLISFTSIAKMIGVQRRRRLRLPN